jgi:hypothetical protein
MTASCNPVRPLKTIRLWGRRELRIHLVTGIRPAISLRIWMLGATPNGVGWVRGC